MAAFGELRWSPPEWSRSAVRRGRERPRVLLGGVALVVALVAVGWGAWWWWSTRPQPVWVETKVIAPRPTALRPDATVDALVVQFSLPVARLEDVGRDVGQALSVSPPLDGAWTWTSDSTLTFKPAADWPVGVDYELRVPPELLAAGMRLREPTIAFTSPRFEAWIRELRFYDDPVDPAEKKLVATLEFTHPVDKAELERRIELRLKVEPVESFDDALVQKPGFRVSYDEAGGKAFIHSERIPLPEREASARLALDAGIRSARGGPGTPTELFSTARVPSVETYFRVETISGSEVTNAAHELERIVAISTSAPLRRADLEGNVDVFLLPRDRPAVGALEAEQDHVWTDAREVVPEVLALAERLPFEWLPTEREYVPLHTLRYSAEAGRALLVRVRKGVRSLGGYALARDFDAVVSVAEFPRALQILHEGAILSLSGERKLSVLSRNLEAVEFEVSRLLPGSIPALVALTSGPFERPRPRSYAFGTDNVAEVFRKVAEIAPDRSGRAQYTAFDFGPFLARGRSPQGLFLLRVRGLDPKTGKPLADTPADERLVLLTDLGVLAKRAVDGSCEVFVLSFREGRPAAGAEVQLLGKNGLPTLTRVTDEQGRASFPPFGDLERERTPLAWLVRRGDDVSFLPIERQDRELNLSRFDVGGVRTLEKSESLQGYLFSDRGIYRPGEEVHLGALVKRTDWAPLPAGLPLEVAVLDPRGLEIRRQRLVFSPEGFEEVRLPTDASSPTGRYAFVLQLVKERDERVELGSTSVRVEEFQPDRISIDARFSGEARAGWLSPDELRGRVRLRNLFGTPAAGARVRGSLSLSPWYAALPGYGDYRFFDPLAAKKSFEESLGDVETDADGVAELPLGLERFERASYRVRFLAEGFEREGGRSVTMDASAIVSPLPHLIAWRSDGELGFLRAGERRELEFIAVLPTLERGDVGGLTLELLEQTTVSVLAKQEDGTYVYQSVRKEEPRASEELEIAAAGTRRVVPSATPGSYVWRVKDAAGTELNRVPFEVVGEGRGGRPLQRDAELRVKLERDAYDPGEEIELEIQAPYAGAGLVTIERERVHAARWMRADAGRSLVRIRVPDALEGNAYVVVSFARALDSSEIFASPLSSSAAPFTLRRTRRTHALRLDVPERIEPGKRLAIGYELDAPARLAVFLVDEGILQVARWQSPDPLGHFFRKRALEVTTSQILDLVLPEFGLLRSAAAPGGDGDAGMLARNLNPFKRKGLPPVVFWSGVFAAPAGRGELSYDVPDHFNGTARVVALAVSPETIGAVEKKLVVRGPFVIRPTVPYLAAPGDELEVSALVARDPDAPVSDEPVRVALATSDGLEAIGEREHALALAPGEDAPVRFRVRALPKLGPASVAFSVRQGDLSARTSVELSVRPPVPSVTTLAGGSGTRAGELELPPLRKLYDAGRDVRVLVSAAPLGIAQGLVAYLDSYPHPCTEQLVSQSFPDLVLGSVPDFERDPEAVRARHARALRVLQGRQDADGAFALWMPGGPTDDLVSVYATHFLIESRERGFAVPSALEARALAHLEELVHVPRASLSEARAQAYALYVLARAGRVRTAELAALREALDARHAEAWPTDLTAAWLASTYTLLRLDADAAKALRALSLDFAAPEDYASYHDALVQRGALLYLLARHQPERARRVTPAQLRSIEEAVLAQRFNSFSAAFATLGLEAYARLGAETTTAQASVIALAADGAQRELPLAGTLLRRASVPADVASLRLRTRESGTLFHALVQTGFEREPPAPRASRVEVTREITDEDGKLVAEARRGDTLLVRVRVRADDESVQIALLDLLPAGLEVDLGSGELAARRSLSGPRSAWSPEYVDVREDRLVFYGWAESSAREFTYRVKAAHAGSFVVPPLFAEGMYDRRAQALGATTQFRVAD